MKVTSNDFVESELTSWLNSLDTRLDKITSLPFIPLRHLVNKSGWKEGCIILFVQE